VAESRGADGLPTGVDDDRDTSLRDSDQRRTADDHNDDDTVCRSLFLIFTLAHCAYSRQLNLMLLLSVYV